MGLEPLGYAQISTTRPFYDRLEKVMQAVHRHMDGRTVGIIVSPNNPKEETAVALFASNVANLYELHKFGPKKPIDWSLPKFGANPIGSQSRVRLEPLKGLAALQFQQQLVLAGIYRTPEGTRSPGTPQGDDYFDDILTPKEAHVKKAAGFAAHPLGLQPNRLETADLIEFRQTPEFKNAVTQANAHVTRAQTLLVQAKAQLAPSIEGSNEEPISGPEATAVLEAVGLVKQAWDSLGPDHRRSFGLANTRHARAFMTAMQEFITALNNAYGGRLVFLELPRSQNTSALASINEFTGAGKEIEKLCTLGGTSLQHDGFFLNVKPLPETLI